MCGIAGVVGATGHDVDVRRMLALIGHRGEPDRAAELLTDSGYTIGCNRLGITDPAHGAQPFVDPRRKLAVVFNGELYNAGELRAALPSFAFETRCDTEVVLAAWSAWGPSAVARLQGMFAFCVLELDTLRPWLARDPLGVKPMYYAEVGDAIAFGSELKCFGGLDDVVVQSLPGGCIWSREGVTRYYRVPTFGTRGDRDVDFAPELRQRLKESVRQHLPDTDGRLAVLLSGGVDSSAVLACAVELGADVAAFTFANAASHSADLEHARALCDALGVPHEIVSPSPDELCQFYLRHGVYMTESYEPALVRNAVSYHFLCRAVRNRGFKLCLSGEGADEVFGGYSWMHALPRHEQDGAIHASLSRVQDTYLQMADRASMYATLEVRVPYMDRNFVAHAVALPADCRNDGSSTKSVLRRAFAGRLIDVCRNRPKVGMNQGAGYGTNEPRSGPFYAAVVTWYERRPAALVRDRDTVRCHGPRFQVSPRDLEEVYAFARFVEYGFHALAGSERRLQLNTLPKADAANQRRAS